MDTSMLDTSRLGDYAIASTRAPFAFLVAEDMLDQVPQAALGDDFPKYGTAGFFPYQPQDCGPTIRALIEELTSPIFADDVGARLGIAHLRGYPTLVTICGSLNRRHGTIHTDSRSKIATALLYLNSEWPDTSDGCLRLLHRIDDIDAMVVPEVRPVYGTLVAFRRADNSFHGHLPFEGERGSPASRTGNARPDAGASRGWSRICSVAWIDDWAPGAAAATRTLIELCLLPQS